LEFFSSFTISSLFSTFDVFSFSFSIVIYMVCKMDISR
jgi:hypothetical protein